MRITYIHQYFTKTNRSYRQAQAMIRAGHEVHMVTSDPSDAGTTKDFIRHEEIDGIQVHWISVPYSNHMGFKNRQKAFLKFAVAATRQTRRLASDLIFATSTPLTVAIPAIIGTIAPRKPLVFEVRDLWPEVPIHMGALRNPLARLAAKTLERVTYAWADHIVTLSPGMAEGVRKVSPRSSISTVSNAADTDLFDVSDEEATDWLKNHPYLPEGRNMALYAGAIGKANRVHYLVDVAKQLHNVPGGDRSMIVVIGEGAELEELKSSARALGVLGTSLFVLPKAPKSEIALAYRAAKCILSTLLPLQVLETSSPNKVFDAFASGKPVLVNYGGWIADVLEVNEAGVALPNAEPLHFAQKIVKILSDPDINASMSEASKRLGQKDFNGRILADKVASIVQNTHALKTAQKATQ